MVHLEPFRNTKWQRNKAWQPLTHAGSILRFGHASWTAVKTLISSLCVMALLVSRAHISDALIDIWKSVTIATELLLFHIVITLFKKYSSYTHILLGL